MNRTVFLLAFIGAIFIGAVAAQHGFSLTPNTDQIFFADENQADENASVDSNATIPDPVAVDENVIADQNNTQPSADQNDTQPIVDQNNAPVQDENQSSSIRIDYALSSFRINDADANFGLVGLLGDREYRFTFDFNRLTPFNPGESTLFLISAPFWMDIQATDRNGSEFAATYLRLEGDWVPMDQCPAVSIPTVPRLLECDLADALLQSTGGGISLDLRIRPSTEFVLFVNAVDFHLYLSADENTLVNVPIPDINQVRVLDESGVATIIDENGNVIVPVNVTSESETKGILATDLDSDLAEERVLETREPLNAAELSPLNYSVVEDIAGENTIGIRTSEFELRVLEETVRCSGENCRVPVVFENTSDQAYCFFGTDLSPASVLIQNRKTKANIERNVAVPVYVQNLLTRKCVNGTLNGNECVVRARKIGSGESEPKTVSCESIDEKGNCAIRIQKKSGEKIEKRSFRNVAADRTCVDAHSSLELFVEFMVPAGSNGKYDLKFGQHFTIDPYWYSDANTVFDTNETAYPAKHDFNWTKMGFDGNLTLTGELDANVETMGQVTSDRNLLMWIDFDDQNSTHFLDKTGRGNALKKSTTFQDNNWSGIRGTRQGANIGAGTMIGKSVIDMTTPYTFAFWVRPEYINGATELTNKPGVFIDGEYLVCVTLNSLAVDFYGMSWCWETVPNLYKWNHIAVTMDGTTARGYLNGVYVANFSPNLSANTQALYLASNPFDDFRVYDRVLSPIDINNLYYEGTLDKNLVGYWKFNDTNGSYAQDYSLENLDGLISGSADTNALGLFDTNALYANGSSGYVNPQTTTLLDGKPEGSICFWMKYYPTSVTVDGAIVSKWNADSGWLFWVDDVAVTSGRTNTLSFSNNALGSRVEGSTNLVTSDRWDHYCGVFKGGSYIKLFKNGVLDQQNTTSIDATFGSTVNPAYIGNSNHATAIKYLNAALEEVKIFDRALSDEEVAADYNRWWTGHYYSKVFDGNANGWCTDCNFNKAKVTFDTNAAMSGVQFQSRVCTNAACSANPPFSSDGRPQSGVAFDLNGGQGGRGRFFQYRLLLDQNYSQLGNFWQQNPFDSNTIHVQDVNIQYLSLDANQTEENLYEKCGSISSSETWFDGNTYLVTCIVIVSDAGTTLTIQPGAVIKYTVTGRIYAQNSGRIVANGTPDKNIIFTSCKDQNAYAGSNNVNTSTRPGCSGAPKPNDYPLAIRLYSTSGMTKSDSFSYLQMFDGNHGIYLDKNIGSVHDSNFGFMKRFTGDAQAAIYLTVASDVNVYNNVFHDFGLGTGNGMPIFFLGTHTGNVHNNLFKDSNGIWTISYFQGINDGKIYNNVFKDLNNSSGLIYCYYLSQCNQDIYDNNIIHLTGSSYGFYVSSNFDGQFHDNNFSNSDATYLMYFASTDSNGSIYRNRFEGQTTGKYGLYVASGRFELDFYDNNFSNFSGYGIRNLAGSVWGGRVYNNRFTNFLDGSMAVYISGTFSGDFYNNTIYNTLGHGIYQAGTMTGRIYDNNFDTITGTGSDYMMFLLGNTTGPIYNNRFFNITNANAASIVASTGSTTSSDIYNNLFVRTNGPYAGFGLAVGTFSGRIFNNTFAYGGTTARAIYNNATFTGSVQRNLFVRQLYGLSGTFSGTVSNNAYYGVSNEGGTPSQHVADQNTTTGFSADPFLADGSDRNFLLNENASGGLKLVNAGSVDSNNVDINNFFNVRTTQQNNKLDFAQVDIGYHHDQNVPFVIVVSPSDYNTLTSTQSIDFNVESGFGQAADLNAQLEYTTTSTGSGTVIIDQNLNQASYNCSTGPQFSCHYSWDTTTAADANYFIKLTGQDRNGTTTDYSDNNFQIQNTANPWTETCGNITVDTNWDQNTYLVTCDVNVTGAGVDLNIAPGTVVKYSGTGTSLVTSNGGRILANGTPDKNIIFTSCKDQNTYTGSTNEDTSDAAGCAGAPSPRDYNTAIYVRSSSGMTGTDSFSYLKIFDANFGVKTDLNIGSIHDSNFGFITNNIWTGAISAIYFPYDSNVWIYNNYFGNMGSYDTYSIRARGYSGQIFNNTFAIGGAYPYYGTGALSGSISKNKFLSCIVTCLSVTDHFYGSINDNNFTMSAWTTGIRFTAASTTRSGNIYNNDFSLLTYSTGIEFRINYNGAYSIYNNRFLSIGLNSTGILISGNGDGQVYNNLFFNVGDANAIASTATFSGQIQRNLFAHVTGKAIKDINSTATVSNNAYFNVTTIEAPSVVPSHHVGDQNTETGFTTDPFIAENTDRNFLLNTTSTGGAKLVNAGGIDSNNVDVNNFFNLRTTQSNNKLDTQTIDIGYHYDQNAPYVQVLSPSDYNVLSGTQLIDFNVESGFSYEAGVGASISYTPTPSDAGTEIAGGTTVSDYTCSSGFPVARCSVEWDTTQATDGNYFIRLTGSDDNGSMADYSDQNFQVLNSPSDYNVRCGDITSDQNWYDGNTYLLTCNVNVTGSSVDLNIQPGAIVKYKEGVSLSVLNNARILANGRADKNIIFTSCKDQNFGADTNAQVGCSGGPSANDYNVAIHIRRTAGMTKSDSFSYLKIRDANVGVELDQNIGSVHDNNFSFFSTSYGRGVLLRLSSDVNIYSNAFQYFSASAAGIDTASGHYGHIYNNFFLDFNASPAIRMTTSTFTGNIYNNRFRGSESYVVSVTNGTFSGSIYDNDFNVATGSGDGIYIASLTVSGAIRDNNFRMGTGIGINNEGGTISGPIFDNRFTAVPGAGIGISNTGTVTDGIISGHIYNNLFAPFFGNYAIYNGDVVESAVNITGDVNNNTIFGPTNALHNGTGANWTGKTQRNLFANVGTVLAVTGGSSYSGTVAFNGYFDVSTPGGTPNNHVGDQNTLTGFTTDPFGGVNDRNFLLNITATGGTKLVDAGGVNSDAFFLSRTTQENSRLDTGKVDIGFHQDQNAPFVQVTSPNDYNVLTGTQTIDFNADRNGTDPSALGLEIYYSTTNPGAGTTISSDTLDAAAYNCSAGPHYVCHYEWDTTGIPDGNYFIRVDFTEDILTATDYSDHNFQISHTSATTVCGDISSDTNWDQNTYLLTCDVNITGAGVDLNIAPGTVIKYKTSANLQVVNGGRLIANGRADANIIFTSCKDQSAYSGSTNQNTELVSGCSGSPALGDYNNAIWVKSDAAMTKADSFSFLRILDSNIGIRLDQNIGSVHDSNFQNIRTTGVQFTRATDANVFQNSFKSMATAIDTSADGSISGHIYRNNFVSATNSIYAWNAGEYRGDIFDNNFTSASQVFYRNGTMFGSIYNNVIQNSANYGVYIINAGASRSAIFNNRFVSMAANANYIVLANTGSADIYNNLLLNGSGTGTGIRLTTAFSGNIYNNTFANFASGGYGIMNIKSFTGKIQRNLFVNMGQALKDINSSATVSNNAYFQVGSTGAVDGQTNNDVNSATGFTTDPFIANGTDRNFLLNTTSTGGEKLVDAGGVDSNNVDINNFFNVRTTQQSNRFDLGTIDIGYHFDQNAPGVIIVSPSDFNTLVGTQSIDFNVESQFGQAADLNAQLEYTTTSTGSGTVIIDQNLNQASYNCSTGPQFTCHYTWDTTTATDGNYYIKLTGQDRNGTNTDYSDNNFQILNTAYNTLYASVCQPGDANVTWYDGNTYYLNVDENLDVRGCQLTIQPGAIVKYKTGGTTFINVTTGGALKAQGTSAKKITFTSANDNSIGASINGSTGAPQKADYNTAIYLAAGALVWSDVNSLDDLNIEFGKRGIVLMRYIGSIHDNNIHDLNCGDFTGGGIAVVSGGVTDIYNNTIHDINGNASGGGIAIYSTSPTITNFYNNVIRNNYTGYGIARFHGAITNFYNNTFTQNQGGSYGGAITSWGGITNFYNNTLTYNTGIESNGGGGGAFFGNGHTITNFYGNVITNNKSAGKGGGVLFDTASGNVTNFFNNTIRDNNSYGSYGGGVYNLRTITNFYNNTITGNVVTTSSDRNGGGLYNLGNIVNFYNNLFADNKARSGGGVWDQNGLINFYSNTFSNNSAVLFGGAILTRDTNGVVQKNYNNIFAFNTGTAVYAQGGQLDSNHNAFWANDTNITGATEGTGSVYLSGTPFIADGTDRNFLLNTNANAGQPLLNAGNEDSNGVDINNFFNIRTSYQSNKLDTGKIDIGYHYDQNGPYVQVLSPSDYNVLSGTQTIDFNFESEFGQPIDLNAQLEYTTQNNNSGTIIIDQNLNQASYNCSTGPHYNCHYTWDTTTATDGNYYIKLTGQDRNGTTTDYSDHNFQINQNNPPDINVIQPDGVSDAASTDFNVVWRVSDPDVANSLKTSCYADTDNVGYTQTYTCFSNVDSNKDMINARMCDLSDWNAGDYYIWCEVNDQQGAGNSTDRNYSPGFLTQAILSLVIYNSDLNLGTLFVLDSNSTEGADRNGLWVENNGNVDSNVLFDATTFFTEVTTTSTYFTYKVIDVESGSSLTGNQSSYTEMPIGVAAGAIDTLNYEDTTDLVRVDLNVTIPGGEPGGVRTTVVTMTAVQA